MKSRAVEILVIDDDPEHIEIIEHILGRRGYRVTAATTAERGLALVANGNFHVLVLDMRLPDRDGIEVLGQIRSRDGDLAVIVLTGYPSVETAVASLKGGVSDYVEKPIDPERLLAAVAKVVEQKGLLRDPEQGLLYSVGTKVRAERKAQGLTLKQVARRTGLSVSLLSQIERAESSASVASLYKIASALGTSLEKIFAGF